MNVAYDINRYLENQLLKPLFHAINLEYNVYLLKILGIGILKLDLG